MGQLVYLGHSFFMIRSSSGDTVIIDPFVTGNPHCPIERDEIECDHILVTHGHGDHLGDAIPIALRTGANLVAIHEITKYAEKKGVVNIINMNFGGSVVDGSFRFTLVPAFHSSGITEVDFGFDGGAPGGFVIEVDGNTIYHAGDTSVFGDMKMISDIYKPDIALLPIGDRFTMGAREAAYATWLISPSKVIPMHWGTFPVIDQTPDGFVMEMDKLKNDKGLNTQVVVMQPGDILNL